MTTSQIFLVTSTFLACAVEMVEALTIVLATGITRGWRSSLIGTLAALATLAVIVAILGPAIALVPIHSMQLVVGTLMLIFGLQWLRKAILRASGRKAMHVNMGVTNALGSIGIRLRFVSRASFSKD